MEEHTKSSRYKLKKLVKTLGSIRGRHTELVTVYVPAGYSLHDISTQLRQEQGTADNIKSKNVRKNVTTALDKILRHVQLYKHTPENGVAFFCGNVSEKEGVADIELWAIEPPEPIKTKMYWCDQTFILDPLKSMVEEKEVYGLLSLDKSDADIALLKGKRIEVLSHFESIVPGKTRAGGQSSARFSRVREGMLNDWLKEVGNAVNSTFEQHKEMKGILLGGPGPIKDMFLKEDYMHADLKNRVLGTVDTSYTGEHGLNEILERGQDLLKEAAVIKEKNILSKFLEHLQKPEGLAVYGIKEVDKYLKLGAVDMIIIMEELPWKQVENSEGQTEFVKVDVENVGNKSFKNILGEKDIVEYFEEQANNFGAKVEIVSGETKEGLQFAAFGGIGAFLRYRI